VKWTTIGIGILLGAVVLGMLAFDLWRRYGETEQQAHRETRNLALVLGADTTRVIHAADQVLLSLSSIDISRPGSFDPDAFERRARTAIVNLPVINGAGVIASDGRMLATTSAGLHRDLNMLDTQWADAFHAVIAAHDAGVERFLNKPIRAATSGNLIVSLNRPLTMSERT